MKTVRQTAVAVTTSELLAVHVLSVLLKFCRSNVSTVRLNKLTCEEHRRKPPGHQEKMETR